MTKLTEAANVKCTMNVSYEPFPACYVCKVFLYYSVEVLSLVVLNAIVAARSMLLRLSMYC